MTGSFPRGAGPFIARQRNAEPIALIGPPLVVFHRSEGRFISPAADKNAGLQADSLSRTETNFGKDRPLLPKRPDVEAFLKRLRDQQAKKSNSQSSADVPDRMPDHAAVTTHAAVADDIPDHTAVTAHAAVTELPHPPPVKSDVSDTLSTTDQASRRMTSNESTVKAHEYRSQKKPRRPVTPVVVGAASLLSLGMLYAASQTIKISDAEDIAIDSMIHRKKLKTIDNDFIYGYSNGGGLKAE